MRNVSTPHCPIARKGLSRAQASKPQTASNLKEMASAVRNSTALFSPCHIVRLLALFIFLPAIQAVYAESATWSQTPANGDWRVANNWVPATVPEGPADVATFGSSNVTSIFNSADDIPGGDISQQVSAITFNVGASGFTITMAEPPGAWRFKLILRGVGIANNSGITQNFVSNSTQTGHGQFSFAGNSTAGNLTVFTTNGAAAGAADLFSTIIRPRATPHLQITPER